MEEEAVYPWEIDIVISRMSDVQERRLAMTNTTLGLKTPNQLRAKGSSEGKYHSA